MSCQGAPSFPPTTCEKSNGKIIRQNAVRRRKLLEIWKIASFAWWKAPLLPLLQIRDENFLLRHSRIFYALLCWSAMKNFCLAYYILCISGFWKKWNAESSSILFCSRIKMSQSSWVTSSETSYKYLFFNHIRKIENFSYFPFRSPSSFANCDVKSHGELSSEFIFQWTKLLSERKFFAVLRINFLQAISKVSQMSLRDFS